MDKKAMISSPTRGTPQINFSLKENFFTRHRYLWVCLFLITAIFAVYWEVTNHEFVNFDDNAYVYENLRVKSGLTLEGITWAFSATQASNWHPLT